MKSQTFQLLRPPTDRPAQTGHYAAQYQLVPPLLIFLCTSCGALWSLNMELTWRSKPVDLLFTCAVCFSVASVAQKRLCTVPPGPVSVAENNTADVQVVKVISSSDVTLEVSVNPEDLFYIKGSVLMVKKGLDYELLPSAALVVWVLCSREGSTPVNESVEVLVQNVNDNPPNFAQNHYVLEVNELLPINSSIGLLQATDVDSEPLYYRLESATDKYFRLESMTSPRILVRSILDYDAVQKVSLVLHVQDTFNGSASNEPFFTSVASITVQVKDVDNRPPWFQPCQRISFGAAKLCVSSGYRGRVNLTEKEEGPLVLEPGPVFARDGDRNRSELISYRILRGNEGNIFQIDEESGNISMTKAADVVGPISLTVLASQVANRDQFAVTQVIIEVMKKSRNPPRFERERYEGFIYSNSVPESMVLRDRSTNRPFRVRAQDEDFAGGVNPDVRYEVQYSSYVNVTSDGFVVLKRVVKTESFALQLRAVDAATGEFGTAALSVQVIPVPAERAAPARTPRLPAVHQRRLPERVRPRRGATLEPHSQAQHLSPAQGPGPPPGEAGPLLLLRHLQQPRPQGEPRDEVQQEGPRRRGRARSEVHPVAPAAQGGGEKRVVQAERGLLRHRGGDHPGHRGPGGGGD
ncbi:cadherin-related family member 5 isoform X2 [Oryzias melastigma]|uniref:cadherin-related family member 5 isoform X2 n=1 Tax=Oryzias melastigma TaxID=30732 RepID=UPI00168D8F7B|nr:cadherin-related family member 5 isoform X2 [Oryzias melastigma]